MEKAHIKPVEALSSFEKNAGEKKDNSPGAIALKATEGVWITYILLPNISYLFSKLCSNMER